MATQAPTQVLRGLRFAAADARSAPGLIDGLAESQGRVFAALASRELRRSRAFRQLFAILSERAGGGVELRFGKHACGFFAAMNGNNIDMDDLRVLPTNRVGAHVTPAELLMHLLEHRLGLTRALTKRNGLDWQLTPGRYGNQYRAELGLPPLMRLTLQSTGGSGPKRRSEFVAVDQTGMRTRIGGIPSAKHLCAIAPFQPGATRVSWGWTPLWR